MRKELEKLLKENSRVYVELGFTKITLYTKHMLKNNEWIFVDKEYNDIHQLVKELREDYIVNYVKDEPNLVLVRNKKHNYWIQGGK